VIIDKIQYITSKKIKNLSNEKKNIIKKIVREILFSLKKEKIIIRKKDRELILKCHKSKTILTIILTRHEDTKILEMEIDVEIKEKFFCNSEGYDFLRES